MKFGYGKQNHVTEGKSIIMGGGEAKKLNKIHRFEFFEPQKDSIQEYLMPLMNPLTYSRCLNFSQTHSLFVHRCPTFWLVTTDLLVLIKLQLVLIQLQSADQLGELGHQVDGACRRAQGTGWRAQIGRSFHGSGSTNHRSGRAVIRNRKI